jgi:hypothetical protein
MSRMPSLTGIALLAMLLALSACTRVVTVRAPANDLPPGSMTAAGNGDAWWRIAIRMRWDPEQTPDWYLDALLADQVYAPALSDAGSAIGLWRFHRRAADDETGHRLSLLTYTNTVSADILYRQIREASVLQWLESDGRVTSVTISKVDQPELPPIARSSDAAWPPEIQASWPWFIMGVSQTWLSLIREVAAGQPLAEASPTMLLDHYRGVDERVTALWRDHGQHVYLHHLNALFGYQPLVIRETNLKRF